MEALCRDLASIVINFNRGSIFHGRGQASDGRFDKVLSHSSVQFGSGTFHFDVHDSIQDAIDLFDDHRKLYTKRVLCERTLQLR